MLSLEWEKNNQVAYAYVTTNYQQASFDYDTYNITVYTYCLYNIILHVSLASRQAKQNNR